MCLFAFMPFSQMRSMQCSVILLVATLLSYPILPYPIPILLLFLFISLSILSFRFACTHKSSWTSNSVEENAISGAFDATKIRNAFLRVFVVLLTDYVESYTAAAIGASMTAAASSHSHNGSIHGGLSLSRSSSSHTIDDGVTSAMTPYVDGKESYLKGVKENIIFINQRNSSPKG